MYVSSFHWVFCALRTLGRPGYFPFSVRNFFSQTYTQYFIYYLGGFFAGSVSLFIEDKHRRGELALYVLPKALKSALIVSSEHFPLLRLILSWRAWKAVEIWLGMATFGVLMAWFQQPNDFMNPMVKRLLHRLFGDN